MFGTTAYAAGPTDMEAHWKLDETTGSLAADSTGNGHDGTYSGPVLGSTGIQGTAAQFNGTSDFVSIPDDPIFSSHSTTGLTVSAWVKVLAVNTDSHGETRQPIVCKGLSGEWEWALYIYSTQQAGFSSWTCDGSNHNEHSGGPAIPFGVWAHVAATFEDGVANRIYVNGQEVASRTSFSGTACNGSRPVLIGAREDGQYLNAVIDDVRIYSRPLSAEEVSALAGPVTHYKLDETSGVTASDSSGNGNDGTYTNGVTLSAIGPYPGSGSIAAEFDGVDGSVDLPDVEIDFSQGISVAFWVKPKVVQTDFVPFYSLSNGISADDIWIGWDDNEGAEIFLSDTVGGAAFIALVDDTLLTIGEWQHYVMTIDSGGNAKIYRNGELSASGFIGLPKSVARTQNMIADSVWNYAPFNGMMDDVRLYNRSISADEVSELYGLVGHWKMDEGVGVTAADSTGFQNDAGIAGATWASDCAGENALTFDGINDEATTNAIFNPPSDGTVAFWMQASDTPTVRQRIFGVNGNWEARLETTGKISFDLGASPFVGNESFATGVVDYLDRWYHVIAMFNDVDDSYAVYVNGELQASGVSPVNLVPQTAGILSLGTRTGSTENWVGSLRDFRIYNRWLSNSEISELSGLAGYWKLDETSGTVAVDSSTNGNDGTYTNGVLINQTGTIGQAADFDGTDDYVGVADDTTLQMDSTFSVSAWIRADDSTNVDRMILNKEGEYEIAISSSGELKWGITNTDPGWSWHSTGYFVSIGKWTHLALTYDNGTVSTYANGVLVDAYSGSGTVGDQYTSLNELRIGGRSNNPTGKYFDGRIDDVRVFSRVMCPEEVFGQYKGGRPAGIRILKWIEVR